MRPTHIRIVGHSRHIFNLKFRLEVQQANRFQQLIEKVDIAIITLSNNVTKSEDINPLLSYLTGRGIPEKDIKVLFPSREPDQLLRTRLSAGLAQSGLTFGADVAERDLGLARYFITTQSYISIESGQRHLVIGAKGSGKSAILRELTKHIGESLVITPEHYATDVLDTVAKGPINTELTAYIITWKYTLLIEIFRRLVHTTTGETAGISEIRKYLLAQGHLGADLSLFERFVAYLGRITKVRGKFGPTEAEIGLDGARELEKLFKMDELLALIPALRRVLRRKTFTVLIDELDQSWNNSETANRFLIALLTAAIDLRGVDANLHVIVFLRSEIFDLLKPSIAQLDKLRTDIEEIRWSARELTNLIVSRAFDSVGVDPERTAARTALEWLFPGVVPVSGVPLFDHILSRTSYRPREVIQFCNLTLKLAIQSESPRITADILVRAEEEFSVWKLEYIVSENLFIYPRLDFLLDRFRGETRRLTFKALDSLLTDILLEFDSDQGAPPWLRGGLEPPKLLELLYRLEIIGLERPNTSASDARVWEAYDFVFSRPKARPEQAQSFLFHPGLWRALELV